MFEFEWDPAKAASNLRKHKVGFELAATVFQDSLMQSILDEDHSEFEQRWMTMGPRSGRSAVGGVPHRCSDRRRQDLGAAHLGSPGHP